MSGFSLVPTDRFGTFYMVFVCGNCGQSDKGFMANGHMAEGVLTMRASCAVCGWEDKERICSGDDFYTA